MLTQYRHFICANNPRQCAQNINVPQYAHGKDEIMKKPHENDKIFESLTFGLDSNAVSHTECTGLIPTPPENDYQQISYQQIENYSPRDIKP